MKKALSREERRAILCRVYDVLVSQHYDPIRQIGGYLMTEDPTYIPDCKNARSLIVSIDRAELLEDLLLLYFDEERKAETP